MTRIPLSSWIQDGLDAHSEAYAVKLEVAKDPVAHLMDALAITDDIQEDSRLLIERAELVRKLAMILNDDGLHRMSRKLDNIVADDLCLLKEAAYDERNP